MFDPMNSLASLTDLDPEDHIPSQSAVALAMQCDPYYRLLSSSDRDVSLAALAIPPEDGLIPEIALITAKIQSLRDTDPHNRRLPTFLRLLARLERANRLLKHRFAEQPAPFSHIPPTNNRSFRWVVHSFIRPVIPRQWPCHAWRLERFPLIIPRPRFALRS